MEDIHVCGNNVGGSSLNISFPVPFARKPRSGVTKTKMGIYALEDLQVDENDDDGFHNTVCTMDNYRSVPPFHDPTSNPKLPEIEDTKSLVYVTLCKSQRTFWRNIVLAS
jgi:hypothetical protein